MSETNFDKLTHTKHYTVEVSTEEQRGYFEHLIHGDERGGGLWFEDNVLTDYDGVAVLPKEVYTALREMGFVVPEEFE